MIVVEIDGGLGNQMFYYATARALSERLNIPFAAYSNPRVVNEHWQHQVGLGHLNVKDFEIITDLSGLDEKGDWFYINVLRTESDPLAIPKDKNIFFSRMWTGEKSFSFLEKELKKELKVKTPPSQKNVDMLKELQSVNSVGVHVRNFFDLTGSEVPVDHCGSGYYKKALEIVKSKVKDPVFYVFCLEMDERKENFKIDGDVVYVDLDNPNYEELRLMYSCKHLIAARSTMSWWALYLHENKEGVRISPAQKSVLNEKLVAAAPFNSIALPHDDMIGFDDLKRESILINAQNK